ncbi:unnamed protein product [Meganyctiphanes norvegica]|uniref:BPL/LPL catalytic domain-containing protein n=1 Tax=Meganyctiphanes norvegica TaxID=48144 RepID=A0AAV2SSI0_MEGNR
MVVGETFLLLEVGYGLAPLVASVDQGVQGAVPSCQDWQLLGSRNAVAPGVGLLLGLRGHYHQGHTPFGSCLLYPVHCCWAWDHHCLVVNHRCWGGRNHPCLLQPDASTQRKGQDGAALGAPKQGSCYGRPRSGSGRHTSWAQIPGIPYHEEAPQESSQGMVGEGDILWQWNHDRVVALVENHPSRTLGASRPRGATGAWESMAPVVQVPRGPGCTWSRPCRRLGYWLGTRRS